MLTFMIQMLVMHINVGIYSFQHHMKMSNIKIEDSVWFQIPESEFQQVKGNHNFLETRFYNLEDIVWFDEPDLDSFNVIHFQSPTENTELRKETLAEENPWENEDEEFANYYFANKWK